MLLPSFFPLLSPWCWTTRRHRSTILRNRSNYLRLCGTWWKKIQHVNVFSHSTSTNYSYTIKGMKWSNSKISESRLFVFPTWFYGYNWVNLNTKCNMLICSELFLFQQRGGLWWLRLYSHCLWARLLGPIHS